MSAAVERWFLRAGLFLLPLAFFWDTYDQFVLPKLLLARVLLLGLLVLFVLRAVRTRSLDVRRTAIDLPLLIFLVSAALSTIFAINRNVSVFGTYARYDGLLTLITYAGLFWLTVQMLRDADDARGLLRTLLVSGYVVAGVAIYQSVSDSVRDGAVDPAYGTLGNANVLGAFLAMVFPLAIRELMAARSWSARVLSINAAVVIPVALLVSFSRSAWLGVAIAAAILVVGAGRRAILFALIAVCLAFGVLIAGRGLATGSGLEHQVVGRMLTVVDPGAWGSSRLHIWADTTGLIASRPILGYGPDTFGLVFPRFETGDWGLGVRYVHQQVDKAHAETLQIAATQGLIGLAAYLLLLAAFVRTAWRGRSPEGLVLFAGWAGYTATVQLNFTALAAAFPFWIFAAACLVVWERSPRIVSVRMPAPRPMLVIGLIAVAAVTLLAVPAVLAPYLADRALVSAVAADASGSAEAASWAMQARQWGPRESVYAVEVANVAFERRQWRQARDAYREAAGLGTFEPSVYRNLALADGALGLREEARVAALEALELNRFDPANQALVAQFTRSAA